MVELIINSDLTLYNTYYNRETGLTEYHRTHIRGVNWQGAKKSEISDKGLKNADFANIYIPMTADFEGKTYIGPRQYAQLDPTIVKGYFTFQSNDKVVKDVIYFEVTGEKGETLKDLERKYDDVLSVMSMIRWDKRMHSSLAHYHVGAQ